MVDWENDYNKVHVHTYKVDGYNYSNLSLMNRYNVSDEFLLL